MTRPKRKKTYCQNCQYPLLNNYNFCPNCGQENNDKLVSFKTLISEFFTNYFAYDSRLIKTIKPFLFKPGFLTKEFVAGRRNSYMHPLRLYFIISFIYFFIFSFVITHDSDSDQQFINFGGENIEDARADSIRQLVQTSLQEELGENFSAVEDSSKTDSVTAPRSQYGDPDFFEKLKIIHQPQVTPEQVLDTLGVSKSKINTLLARQAIRISNERGDNIKAYLVKNASLMMFLLLPFFALVLKLFYLRRSFFYVEHITFALHIHSFMFFILSIYLIIDSFYSIMPIWIILIIMIYFSFSFKNVYKQNWKKTLLKLYLLFVCYITSFSLFLFFTILISLLLF